MIIHIPSAAELGPLASQAFYELLDSDQDDPLELVLAPGTYPRVRLSLDDGWAPRSVALIIRGADPTRPPILDDPQLSLRARRIRLEGLMIRATRSPQPFHFAVDEDLEMLRCAFLELSRASHPVAGCILSITAREGAERAQILVEQTCFLGAHGSDDTRLGTIDALPPAGFERVRFVDVRFLDNAVQGLQIGGVRRLELERVYAFHPTATEQDDWAGLLDRSWPGTQLHITDSRLVSALDEGQNLAQMKASTIVQAFTEQGR